MQSSTDLLRQITQRCGSALKHLSLTHDWIVEVDSQCIHELANRCPNLESLDIRCSGPKRVRRITDEDIDFLAKQCPKLRVVKLNLHGLITEVSVQSLLKHCPQIQEIHTFLCGCTERFQFWDDLKDELKAAGRRVRLG